MAEKLGLKSDNLCLIYKINLYFLWNFRRRDQLFNRCPGIRTDWMWRRYYEDKEYAQKPQTKKQRVEKILLIIVTFVAVFAHVMRLLVQLHVVKGVDIDVLPDAFNVTDRLDLDNNVVLEHIQIATMV